MSWVVSRHLFKSGGNNIHFRIGQFNKFSSSQMLHCKNLSTALMCSPHCMKVQQTLKRSRKENMLHNMYSSVDQYISHKLLSPSDPKINHSKQKLWMKTYAREIIDCMHRELTRRCSELGGSPARRAAATRRSQRFVNNRIELDAPIALGAMDPNTRRRTPYAYCYLRDAKKIIEENKKYYSITMGAPLPDKWTEYMDNEGDMGYYNLDTKEITYSSAFILLEEIKKIKKL